MPALFASFATYVLPFAAVITLIVTVHEMGHFLTARAFGTAVDRFSIGFGHALVKWRDRSGVEWRVGWLPLGGYVKFAGDENVASVPTRDDIESLRAAIVAREGPDAERRYLPFKPLWQRTLIILAGPAANFVLAVVLFSVFVGVFGEPVTKPVVAGVMPGGAAARAGFEPGDLVLTADGKPVASFEDLRGYVQYRGGVPIRFTVQRHGERIAISGAPDSVLQPSLFGGRQAVGVLGLTASSRITLQRYGPLEAVEHGVGRTWDVTANTVFVLGRIASGQIKPDQLHSIIGIDRAVGKVAQGAVAEARHDGVSPVVGLTFYLIQITAMISVSVGLLNLLPIPTLDGGFLLFYGYELVARRPPRAALQAAGFRMGLAAILALFLFAAWNDLQQLRVFAFVGNLFS